ncbi:MAG: hypothetical protein IJL14_10865, partial [Selenomonadaceae bacterium]|nr:hypothetical protein [Selenomonadaceae bacterium]
MGSEEKFFFRRQKSGSDTCNRHDSGKSTIQVISTVQDITKRIFSGLLNLFTTLYSKGRQGFERRLITFCQIVLG